MHAPNESGATMGSMNANFACLSCRAVEMFIKSSEEQGATWCTLNKRKEQLLLGDLLGFINKPVTVLGVAAFEFYPFHLTLLNLTEERKRGQVQDEYVLVAYFQI